MINAVEEAVVIEIRLFNNRFAWKWDKFTDDKSVVARILQTTRENLGYSANTKFEEVQFQNIVGKDYDGNWTGTGEWMLNTHGLQSVLDITSSQANTRLYNAFTKACKNIGTEYGINFEFDVFDMVQPNKAKPK